MSRSASTCLLIAHWEFLMYAWILCCDIDMIDHLDLGLRMSFFLYFIAILVWYIDMPIIIDCSSCLLGIAILSLPDYSAHFTCIDSLLYVVWLAVLFPLACILSWSSFEHDVCIVIRPDSHSFLRGHEWYILYSTWLHVAWLPSLCVIACRLSLWAAHISFYLQLSWFRSFLSS